MSRKPGGGVERDVVVVGSGGAGLAAALSASLHGARVVVLERSSRLGGTTAISGGGMWIPQNPFMAEMGVDDSRQEALTYTTRVAMGRTDHEVLETFVDEAPRLFDLLQTHTAAEIEPAWTPDYQPGFEGAKSAGRQIALGLFDLARLGDMGTLVRRAPWWSARDGGAMSNPSLRHEEQEAAGWGMSTQGRAQLIALANERHEQGIVGRGCALVAALVAGCAAQGVTFVTGARARALLNRGGRVAGVTVETEEEGTTDYIARAGVVLATGGFEWNRSLVNAFLSGPLNSPLSPPLNEGDGLLMAAKQGALLGTMDQAWWATTVSIPGEQYEGKPAARWSAGRGLPGMIIVNRQGRRFANEGLNYNDFPHAMTVLDPHTLSWANHPAFVVFDAGFRERYPLINYWELDMKAGSGWLVEADTLEELGMRAGIDPAGLVDQVRAFNQHAVHGEDPVFHRGENDWGRYRGDSSFKNPNLGPLDRPPFYAYRIELGCLGTKGGPVTDRHARVRRAEGGVVPGLCAAGNAAASIFGPGYPGGGATLGPGLTFGMIAGETLTS
jgi:3-oxosteroid 1-dehydrogenase